MVAQEAETPAGKPVAEPMPVALVVVWVILVRAELIHKVGAEEAAVTVFTLIVIVPVAFTLPHPPVKGML